LCPSRVPPSVSPSLCMARPIECLDIRGDGELKRPLSPQKLSKPQKRRRRLQLLAVNRAARQPESGKCMPHGLSAEAEEFQPAYPVEARLASIEVMVSQLHWGLLGARGFDWSATDAWTAVGDQPEVQGSHFSGSSHCFQSLPKDAWERIYGLFEAGTVEACDAQSLCGEGDTSENASADYDEFCSGCGKPFRLPTLEADYDGDRCDLCGAPFHTECLQTHHDLKGEWQLCGSCIADRRRDACPISGDFRRLSACYWTHLYSKFDAVAVARHSTDVYIVPPSPTLASFQSLDAALDHMLMFLEGQHAKSSNVPEDVRSTVLGCIKSAMAWKQTARSKQDIEKYVTMINGVMGEIVRKL